MQAGVGQRPNQSISKVFTSCDLAKKIFSQIASEQHLQNRLFRSLPYPRLHKISKLQKPPIYININRWCEKTLLSNLHSLRSFRLLFYTWRNRSRKVTNVVECRFAPLVFFRMFDPDLPIYVNRQRCAGYVWKRAAFTPN